MTIVAEDDLAERIAHQDDVSAGGVDELGEGVVVCGERDDFFAAFLHFRQVPHIHPATPGLALRAHERHLIIFADGLTLRAD
jgi:hypothetical protein